MSAPALLIAAAAPESGVTTVTLGLAMAMQAAGRKVGSFKTGADAHDSVMHGWALRRPCVNIDSWAMRLETMVGLLDDAADGVDLLLGDGHGGLFDDASDGRGSVADLAALLGLPVVLVVDAGGTGGGRSMAAMVEGLLRLRSDFEIVAIVLNRVRSAAHAGELIQAFDDRFSTPVLGYLLNDDRLTLEPHHHQAARALDGDDLDPILGDIETAMGDVAELDRLARLARRASVDGLIAQARPLPVLGQRIAIAHDEAFAFGMEAVFTGWHRQGAQIFHFSPMADETPHRFADAVYLPPGVVEHYPALLATRREFLKGLIEAASRDAVIYGEGLGYGVLCEYLADSEGNEHAMTGMLPARLTAGSANEPLAGYRRLVLAERGPLGPRGSELKGWDDGRLRESNPNGDALFQAHSADAADLGSAGCARGRVMGSPLRLLDRNPHLAVVRG